MNKNILMTIVVIIFFLILGVGVYYYFLTKSVEEMLVLENLDKQEKTERKEDKRQIDITPDNYDERIKVLNGFLANVKDKKSKDNIKRGIAYEQLAKRDETSIFEAIYGFKEIVKTTKDNEIKAKNLNSLAGLYFILGGSETIFKKVFSGEYEKYAKNANGNVGKTIIALFKEAYNIYPNPRSAVELAYWYADMGNLKEAKVWIETAESYEKVGHNTDIRKFEAYGKLAILDTIYLSKFKKSFKKFDEQIKNFDIKKGNYRKGYNQSIPFLGLFYISTLYEIDSKKYKDEISKYAEKIVDFVENDPKSQYNEFQYFLNIQKAKKEMDVMAKDLNGIAKLSPKFKAFLEKYGFKIK